MLFNMDCHNIWELYCIIFEIKMSSSTKLNLKLGENEDAFSFISTGDHLEKKCLEPWYFAMHWQDKAQHFNFKVGRLNLMWEKNWCKSYGKLFRPNIRYDMFIWNLQWMLPLFFWQSMVAWLIIVLQRKILCARTSVEQCYELVYSPIAEF